MTRGFAIPGGSEDFLWRRNAMYPSGFTCESTPDGVGKLQMPKLRDPWGGSAALLPLVREPSKLESLQESPG